MESWLPQINEDPIKERQIHQTVFKHHLINEDLNTVKFKVRSKSKYKERLTYIKSDWGNNWANLLEGLEKYAAKIKVDQKPKRGLGYRSKPPPINNTKTISIYKNSEDKGIVFMHFNNLSLFWWSLGYYEKWLYEIFKCVYFSIIVLLFSLIVKQLCSKIIEYTLKMYKYSKINFLHITSFTINSG